VRHLFVCTNHTSSGKPACGARGGAEFLALVQRKLLARGASGVLATPCGCLGPCFDGPNAVIYPDADWYGHLDEADADAIVAHLIDGIIHDDKKLEAPGT